MTPFLASRFSTLEYWSSFISISFY